MHSPTSQDIFFLGTIVDDSLFSLNSEVFPSHKLFNIIFSLIFFQSFPFLFNIILLILCTYNFELLPVLGNLIIIGNMSFVQFNNLCLLWYRKFISWRHNNLFFNFVFNFIQKFYFVYDFFHLTLVSKGSFNIKLDVFLTLKSQVYKRVGDERISDNPSDLHSRFVLNYSTLYLYTSNWMNPFDLQIMFDLGRFFLSIRNIDHIIGFE